MSKTESFKKPKPDYRYDKDGYHQRRPGAKGLDKHTEYLKWDAQHNEVETFSNAEKHIGAYDPATKKLYKPAVPTRKLNT